MFSNRRIRRSFVSPNPDEREIIALLMLAGEQFDELKRFVWPDSNLYNETIFSAAKLLQKYMKLADYVPPSKRSAVIMLAFDYKVQFDRLIESIGQKEVDLLGDVTEKTIREERNEPYHFEEYADFSDNQLIHTMFRTGNREPIKKGTLSYFALKPAVKALAQRRHREFVRRDHYFVRDVKEEPTIPTAPILRPPRKRRFSMVNIENDCTPTIKLNSERENVKMMAAEDSSYILEDAAFEERIEPIFVHYCRAPHLSVSNEFRWGCSRNLREVDNGETRDEFRTHRYCRECVRRETNYSISQSMSGSIILDERKFFREFEPVLPKLMRKRELI